MKINRGSWMLLLFMVLLLSACAGGPKPKPEPIMENVDKTVATADLVQAEFSALERAQLKEAIENINAGKLNIAKKSLLQLQKNAPKNSLVLSNLAAIAYTENKAEEANTLATKALSIRKDNPQAYNIIGLVAVERGDVRDAEQAYIKALNINNSYANAHFNLALVYDIYYQDVKSAIRHYQAYLALSDFQDKKTLEWVQELERSLEKK